MKIKVTGTGSSQKKICCEKAKPAISTSKSNSFEILGNETLRSLKLSLWARELV